MQNVNKQSKIWIINYAPAIDYYVDVTKQQRGVLTVGGKGINVAIVLQALGIKSTILTFLGEPTKQLFLQLAKPYELDLIDFCSNTQTRINLKLLEKDKTTEINDIQPEIATENVNKLTAYMQAHVKPNDLLIINGRFLQRDLKTILKAAFMLTEFVVVDIDEQKLFELVDKTPWLAKPNLDEFSRIVKQKITNEKQLIAQIKQFKASKLLLLSDGERGAYLWDQQKLLFVKSLPCKQVVSTTGAGDTLLAVFLGSLILKEDTKTALMKATVYASATVNKRGVVDKNDQITVQTPDYYYL